MCNFITYTNYLFEVKIIFLLHKKLSETSKKKFPPPPTPYHTHVPCSVFFSYCKLLRVRERAAAVSCRQTRSGLILTRKKIQGHSREDKRGKCVETQSPIQFLYPILSLTHKKIISGRHPHLVPQDSHLAKCHLESSVRFLHKGLQRPQNFTIKYRSLSLCLS